MAEHRDLRVVLNEGCDTHGPTGRRPHKAAREREKEREREREREREDGELEELGGSGQDKLHSRWIDPGPRGPGG